MLEIDESLQQTEPDSSKGSKSNDFILRRPTKADMDSLVALAVNPTLTKNLCNTWLPNAMDKAQNWLEAVENSDTSTIHPFVMVASNGSVIGATCLILEEDRKQAEISVVVTPGYWHQGVATRAVQGMADFAFSNPSINQGRLETLLARCRVSCGKSRRIMEKCGFQYCGTGMAYSQHYRGQIPIDRYRFDRGIWTALHNWADRDRHSLSQFAGQRSCDLKGAA